MSDPDATPAAAPPADAAMSDAPAAQAVQIEAVAPSSAPTPSAVAAASSPAPAVPATTAAAAGADSRNNKEPRDKQDPKRRRRDRGDWQPIPVKDKPAATEDGSGSDDDEGAGAGARLGKKRKVALAVMYRGTAYCGLQLQNGPQQTGLTVERVILDAVHAAGGIAAANMDSTQKIKWMRAARTDKGVHAAGNLLSLMMICDGPAPAGCLSSSPNIIDRINAHLPADVRAIAYTRTLGSFHAKYSCASRVYEYILPSFVFDHSPDTIKMLHDADAAKAFAVLNPSTGLPDAPYSYPPSLLAYRLPPEKRAEIDSICALFEGTHNFQNFTRKKSSFLKDAAKSEKNDKAAAEKRKRKDKDDSEEEGAEGDDAEEEAAERAAIAAEEAAAAAAGAAASSSASPAAPSPFTLPKKGSGIAHAHPPLLVHLKALNTKAGATANTNKQSGQFARFIRFIIKFGIVQVYLPQLPEGQAAVAAAADASSPSSSAVAPAAAASSSSSPPSMEFVRLQIHGQSFMLNQIRKMIGAVIIVARRQLDRSYLTDAALAFAEYSVPTAPSLGLLLDRPVYSDYDARLASGNVRGTKGAAAPAAKKKDKQDPAAAEAAASAAPAASLGTGVPPEDRARIEDLFLGPSTKPVVDAFREQYIYRAIGDAEVTSGSAARWVSALWAAPTLHQQKRRLAEMARAEEERERRFDEEEAQRNGQPAKASDTTPAEPAMADTPAAAAVSLPSVTAAQ